MLMLICLQSSEGFHADSIFAGQALEGIVTELWTGVNPAGCYTAAAAIDSTIFSSFLFYNW